MRFRRPRVALTDSSGIIVLGPLILIVVTLTLMVVLGWLLYPRPEPYVTPTASRQLHAVTSATDIVLDSKVVLRLQPGDSVWAMSLGNGNMVVFESQDSERVVGFVSPLALSPTARPRVAPGTDPRRAR